MPWLVSLAYRAFGVTASAELALSLVAIALVTASFFFAYALARQLDIARPVRLGALVAVALLPVQMRLEAHELKVWEAPLVVAVIMGVLAWAVRLDRRETLGWQSVAWLIVPGAVLFLVSPPASLVVFGIVALLAIRRLPARQGLTLGLLAAVATTAVTLPWALRNQRMMGRMIWTRDNAGLELALAYNDTLLRMPDQHASYLARMNAIHPNVKSGEGYARMKAAGGPLPYYDRLRADTMSWIAAHPAGTAQLVLRHLRQYLVPPSWFLYTWGSRPHAAEALRWLVTLPLLIGIAGLPLLIADNRRYLYPVLAAVLLAAPYIVFQPILRYRYLTSTLAVFLAAAAAATAWRWWRERHAVQRQDDVRLGTVSTASNST